MTCVRRRSDAAQQGKVTGGDARSSGQRVRARSAPTLRLSRTDTTDVDNLEERLPDPIVSDVAERDQLIEIEQ
jgi:hypothetical protein